jgi:hypothetical protein
MLDVLGHDTIALFHRNGATLAAGLALPEFQRKLESYVRDQIYKASKEKWRLRTDTSPTFWSKIGRITERLGYPKFPLDEAS